MPPRFIGLHYKTVRPSVPLIVLERMYQACLKEGKPMKDTDSIVINGYHYSIKELKKMVKDGLISLTPPVDNVTEVKSVSADEPSKEQGKGSKPVITIDDAD